MACVLAGLHYGITQRCALQDGGDLPRDFYTALSALRGSTRLAAYLPAEFPALYVALREAETADLFGTVSAQEFAWYL
jgi:glutamine synthetase